VAAVATVAVPDIGDFTDVPVVELHVSAGDTVSAEDPLITLESDKATMDVPAPFAGTVAELLVKVGDLLSEGSPIVRLEPAGEAVDDTQSPTEPEPREAVLAESQSGAPAAVDRNMSAPWVTVPADTPGNGDGSAPPAERLPPYASPSVRRRARELGVDLVAVSGSGRKGRIVLEDVEAASRAPQAPAGAPALDGDGAGLGLAPWPKVDFARYGEIEVVPLSRIRRIAGPNLHRNWVRIPHVTHHEEADITELEAFRKQTNAENDGVKVTMVALLMKACAATLKAFPEFNSSLEGEQLVLKRYYHLGFAADTPQGLLVPVIRDVDRKGLLDIARELTALSGKAREGKLAPTEMQGATFTISSLGGIGGTGFTPIINAPEVAILGVTRSQIRPQWNGEEFVPRLMLPLSLSYDHRVIDGAAAARFCVHLRGVLEDLRRVLW
jgi:pyruvate dehydrogenase E2 component (dihydrolipoamide acetyltransferase)